MDYFESIAHVKDDLVGVLRGRGIDQRYLGFGGPGDPPTRKPTVPTDSRSEFLANRAMGDWAEDILAGAIRQACPRWTVAHYGNAERIAAGEPGFKEFYLAGMEEVRRYGKRPDLLIFESVGQAPENLTAMPFEQADPLVLRALAAIEVRSSKFEALRYMRVRRQDRENGAAARGTPSFTVKVEDLRIVYRWLERYRIPQSYCQVFFDVVYGINFLDIFRIIASGGGFQIENPAKSQEKATVMIPITSGQRLGEFSELPRFEARERITRLGRHDAFVVPIGGKLTVDAAALERVLCSSQSPRLGPPPPAQAHRAAQEQPPLFRQTP